MDKELKHWIMTALPENGEWWSSGYETFIDVGDTLFNYGMPRHEIKETLSDLYSAVSSEYGN